MGTCKDNKKGCGCDDGPLKTIPVYVCPPDSQCPTPQLCDEFIDPMCVSFQHFGIPDIGVTIGMSLAEVMQRQSIALDDPTCLDPLSSCQSSTLIYPASKTDTTILVAWMPSATAVSYQLEYKEESSGTWLLLPSQASGLPTQAQITGLITGTTYTIRVNSTCGVGNCYSAIITVKTN